VSRVAALPVVASDDMSIRVYLSACDFNRLSEFAGRNSLTLHDLLVDAAEWCRCHKVSFISADAAADMQRLDQEAA
jgi:hypothetical protein